MEEKWFNDLGTFHAAVKKELLLKLYYNDTQLVKRCKAHGMDCRALY